MDDSDASKGRAYYAQRAAEELALAESAADAEAAKAHRQLQRLYLERASVGERASPAPDEIG
ncbi:MAG: hypothetical protein ACLGHC_08480 [Alphaproteobacteria bacterium]